MSLITSFLQSPTAAVFVIIALGAALGRLRLAGLSLGSAGVLLVAMAFGHARLVDPVPLKPIGDLGVVFFVYAVGLRAGPRIVAVVRGQGQALVVIALATIATATIGAAVVGNAMGLDAPLVAGIFAGAMTSTPALAAATDASGSHLVAVGYGVAYPVGVLVVVLLVQLLPRFVADRPDRRHTTPGLDDPRPTLEKRAFRVENPACIGKSVESLRLREMVKVNVSRVIRGSRSLPATATLLEPDDIVLAVGSNEQLERLAILIGPRTEIEALHDGEMVARDIYITERAVAGRSLRQLDLTGRFGVVLTRVRREMIEFTPSGRFVLEIGDQVRAVGPEAGVEGFARVAGFHEERIQETGILAFSVGLVLGLLAGFIALPLPGGTSVRLGAAGGPLIVGLLFGHFGRIGGVRVHVPPAARYLMRELGLLFFLVAAGAEGGSMLMPVLKAEGSRLFLLAAGVVVPAVAVSFLLAFGVFRQSLGVTMGLTCGALTSTPGLGLATARLDSDAPALAYAAVYPAALIGLTVAAQVLVRALG